MHLNVEFKVFLITVLVAIVVSAKVDNVSTAENTIEVRMYTKRGFEGRYIKIKLHNEPCINLPPIWDKQINSVDPLGCIICYAEADCRGLRRRLERWSWGSQNLKDISFDNMISSISPCPKVAKIIIPDEL